MDITFTLQSTSDGSLLIGQANSTTVYISIDGGSYTATTNSVSEIGRGAYKVTLTSSEAAFQTLLYAPVCTGAQSNIYQLGVAPNIQSELTTYGTAKSSEIPDISGLATASDVTTAQADIISAMPDISGLSTFDASEDTVTIASTQASSLINGVLNATVANRDTGSLGSTVLAISGYTDEVESKIDSVSTKLADLPIVRALLDHWAVSGSTLTCYDSTGNVLESCTLTKDENGEIIAVTPND